MLYLFNSGYRPLYLKNVLNTLFLPRGCANEYRYKSVGEPRYVSPAVYSKLPDLAKGTDCVVSFIDRFEEHGYNYHPLRRGKFLSYREADNYLYFRLELGAFLYPRDLAAFRRFLVQALGASGLPQLTDGNPMSTNDGAYTILSESVFGRAEEYLKDDEAWTAAVENLSQTRAFSVNAEQSPLFLKADVHQRSSDRKSLAPHLRDGVAIYGVEKDEAYQLLLTYRFPRQRIEQGANARLEIKLGDNLRALGDTSISIDSHANSVLVPFASKRYIEDSLGSVTLLPVDEPGEPKLVMTESSIQYRIRESTAFWLQTASALLLFSFAGAFIGIDLSHLHPFSFQAFVSTAWPKLTAGLVQTGALFWVFRLIGKKVL